MQCGVPSLLTTRYTLRLLANWGFPRPGGWGLALYLDCIARIDCIGCIASIDCTAFQGLLIGKDPNELGDHVNAVIDEVNRARIHSFVHSRQDSFRFPCCSHMLHDAPRALVERLPCCCADGCPFCMGRDACY